MRQIRKFRSNFENISRDCHETFVRVSHDIPTNVALVSFSFVRQSRDVRESVLRHSYECCLVLFSCQIVVNCLHVFSRLLSDCRTTFV